MKAYAYIAAFLALLGAFWGVYRMGGSECRAASATAAREHVESQNRLLLQIEEAKQAREVVYRDKIKIVERVSDNCTDAPIPEPIRVQLSNRGETKPTPNP